MLPWALLLCLPLGASATAVSKTLGVAPDLLDKYSPSKAGTWRCLDGSKEIPWDFVNDDSCDCADGSDEPGTSACPDNYFYCKNEGHIGQFIPSSRVNDGLCESLCCDGTDEASGVCPNLCKEIGAEYQRKRKAEMKLRKTGSKVRSTYIAFAHKEKKRLEAEVEQLAQEIELKQKEVDRLQEVAERAESLSAAALEQKKQSPLYQSLITHHQALKSLQREYKKQLEKDKTLSLILDTLRTSYNPNYQDMGVLEAVRGWEEIAGLPHINDVGKDEAAAKEASDEAKSEEKKPEEVLEEGAWSAEKLNTDLDSLLKTDHVSLLLSHDDGEELGTDSIIYQLSAYLPDSFLPAYEDFRDTFLTVLSKVGIVKRPENDNTAAESSRARTAHTEAAADLAKKIFDKSEKEKAASKIFTVEGFGREGEWKKLDKTCLSLDVGEYVYEVCLFDEVKQKPTNGGQQFSLGRYQSWNNSPDVQPGTPAYYSKQVYKFGTRCWNGPERNTVVVLECGIENAITTVQELEKCEYQITGTSPALCLPPDEAEGKTSEKKAPKKKKGKGKKEKAEGEL